MRLFLYVHIRKGYPLFFKGYPFYQFNAIVERCNYTTVTFTAEGPF